MIKDEMDRNEQPDSVMNCSYLVKSRFSNGLDNGLCRNPNIECNYCYGKCEFFQNIYESPEEIAKIQDKYFDEAHKYLEKIRELVVETAVNAAKENGYLIFDYAIIANPKLKYALAEVFSALGNSYPVMYTKYCEEDKMYVVTDPELVKNIKDSLEDGGE